MSAYHFSYYYLLIILLLEGCTSFLLPFTHLQQKRLDAFLSLASKKLSPAETSEQILFRNAYREPANWISNVELDFQFQEKSTRVTSKLTIKANENHCLSTNDLVLNGDAKLLSLVSIRLDDQATELIDGSDYNFFTKNDTLLVFESTLIRPQCLLTIVVDLHPKQNTVLEGLYHRDDMYCTHCEPAAMQKITFFADRPDNCAYFEKVRLEADKERYPILLSNGNLQSHGVLKSDPSRHYAIYNDPFPKPSYLFGLVVAGNSLGKIEDSYTTISGKVVDLVIYGEHEQLPRLTFAMDTLKKAIQWDESKYGLECDLDVYRIVAARHFILGAMENKGLNLFMTSLIATDPSTTTDITYDLVEKTIAHEYFHNWSGNRVTIRDWFEFTLKEGLTVYRDQEFTSDVGLRTATRIEAVKILREKQFAEDASPDRKPIRPENYLSRKHSLAALATSTSYHKGAEVCRMYETILTTKGFRKGLNLYMERHDGTGATCEDFQKAMADANPDTDLKQFSLWYSTAGTPRISYAYSYQDNQLKLRLSQQLPDNDSTLLHIPITVGLLNKETGQEVVPSKVLNLKQKTQTFVFDNLSGNIIPSMLRDFSAPVILLPADDHKCIVSEEEQLAFLATYDTDEFNKWEAMQNLFSRYIFKLMSEENEEDRFLKLEAQVMIAFGQTLQDSALGHSSKSYILNLPTESVLSRQLDKIPDPIRLLDARKEATQRIARKHSEALQHEYNELSSIVIATSDITDVLSRATRSLRNRCLEYLCSLRGTRNEQEIAGKLALRHFDTAICFTDQFIAFRQLASMSGAATDYRNEITLKFYEIASSTDNPALMNKWFQVQALADLSDALPRVQALMQNPSFQANNAGRFRSLITSFTMNTRSFHTQAGYQFIGGIIRQMDRRAPPLAVELANKLCRWTHYDGVCAEWMKAELYQISLLRPISNSLLATVTKALPTEYKVSSTPLGRAKNKNEGKKRKDKKKKIKMKGKKGFS